MNKKLVRNLLIIFAISIAITIVFSSVFSRGYEWNAKSLMMNVLYAFLVGGSISLSGVIARLVFRMSDMEKYPSRTYIIMLFSVFIYISFAVILLNLLWYRYSHNYEFGAIYRNTGIILSTVITIFIGLTIFFIILSNNYMKRLVGAEREVRYAREEADSAKFETLKSQINPHFLFNSLNSLSSLIHTDKNRADEFVNQLSNIYRYILDHQDDELVKLNEEIEFVKKYAFLQAIRFDDNFILQIENGGRKSKNLIIPFSLQLLLENVLKHNIISEKEIIKVNISISDDYLVFSNNKSKNKKKDVSHNIGLKNIINRYGFISDKKVIVEETENEFAVKLPLISEN